MSDKTISKMGSTEDSDKNQAFNLLFNESSKQLKIQDPVTGQTLVFTAQPEEQPIEDEEPEEYRPIPVVEFQDALRKIDEIGITWTSDSPPRITPKDPEKRGALFSREIQILKEKYPYLPLEVGSIIRALLMGKEKVEYAATSENEFLHKAATVKELLITPQFRSEFFFKNSTKVPHLLDVDWEVVVKHREMNVVVKPNVAYGLLSLLLQSPENSGWGVQKRRNTVTVALDEQLIAKLITSLVNLKEALQKTSKELEETGAKE